MAGRQLVRGLPSLVRSAAPLVGKSAVCVPRQAATGHNLAARLSGVRCMSGGPGGITSDGNEIINIQDEADFQRRVIDSDRPVIVDFHASWCGPCKLLGPRLETLVAEEKGGVVMAKIDIDDNVDIAMRYNVQSIPTVYGVKNGKIQQSFIGMKDDDEIKKFIKGIM